MFVHSIIFFSISTYYLYIKSSESPHSYPREIAGLHITKIVDLTSGYDSSNPPSYEPSLPLSSGHMIQFRAENKINGTKIVLTIRYVEYTLRSFSSSYDHRTSGTEPKVYSAICLK